MASRIESETKLKVTFEEICILYDVSILKLLPKKTLAMMKKVLLLKAEYVMMREEERFNSAVNGMLYTDDVTGRYDFSRISEDWAERMWQEYRAAFHSKEKSKLNYYKVLSKYADTLEERKKSAQYVRKLKKTMKEPVPGFDANYVDKTHPGRGFKRYCSTSYYVPGPILWPTTLKPPPPPPPPPPPELLQEALAKLKI